MTTSPRSRLDFRFSLPSAALRLRAATALAALLAALLAGSLAGCNQLGLGGGSEEYLIPEYSTAREQFYFAEGQRQYTQPSLDLTKREEQMNKIIACYEAVENRFPDDRDYTPLAKLSLGMLWQRRPERESKLKAIEYFTECQKRYGDQDNILARSLYEEGLALDTLGQYERAQEKYRTVFTRFGKSSEPDLKTLSNDARSRYNKVHTKAQGGF
jgi:tetratricopeptide (TPR) repeat protein